ncbi:beta-1,4-glucuronyltransferase 1-like [Tigriopus californicus]|uniref:beta-1,4-glucuronyltransferase 1-like n=1 Tax=Tigriopus californicus TaxID=6832 RepID=UPI0027D9F6C3|nr:beta-1,4-glucuronyltransferase 1-like [Tigriopus californicus]
MCSQSQDKFHLNEDLTCLDKEIGPRIVQRGKYWVFENYIQANKRFHCNESVTFTTHSDPTFLNNLQPLLERWQGPISLAIYAPSTDFSTAVKAIMYQRQCQTSDLVRDLVTFHLFFDFNHMPPSFQPILKPVDISTYIAKCNQYSSEEINPVKEKLYKSVNNLPYPVNVARNVARETSNTHFVFPCDIELYPSPGFIPEFLDMIRRNDPIQRSPKPKVYPLVIFEIDEGQSLPSTKKELIELYALNVIHTFHFSFCLRCHLVPRWNEWIADASPGAMEVFTVGNRQPPFEHWEPIFIGSHSDPLYDERLSWDGQRDKMTQGYVMCVQEYEFHVLNNAFLIHKPGVKTKEMSFSQRNETSIEIQKKLVFETIAHELELIYGTKGRCTC